MISRCVWRHSTVFSGTGFHLFEAPRRHLGYAVVCDVVPDPLVGIQLGRVGRENACCA